MKKLGFLFAVVVAAIMASCGNSTPKADLKGDIDTLSYAIGLAQSQGLRMYLAQRMGMDTTYIDEFIKGLNDGANAGDDKKKAAYFAGIQIGQQISQQMIPGINHDLFGDDSTQTLSMKNFMAGFVCGATETEGLMTREEAGLIAERKMQEVKAVQMEKKYGEWKKKNEEYIAKMAKNTEYKAITDSVNGTLGTIYYQVIEEGKGEVPQADSEVVCHYEGKDIEGNIFDSSIQRGEPIHFHANQVVAGWTMALTHMPVGSKWKVVIPAELAYGQRDAGTIKPYSVLEFIIELKEIVKHENK